MFYTGKSSPFKIGVAKHRTLAVIDIIRFDPLADNTTDGVFNRYIALTVLLIRLLLY